MQFLNISWVKSFVEFAEKWFRVSHCKLVANKMDVRNCVCVCCVVLCFQNRDIPEKLVPVIMNNMAVIQENVINLHFEYFTLHLHRCYTLAADAVVIIPKCRLFLVKFTHNLYGNCVLFVYSLYQKKKKNKPFETRPKIIVKMMKNELFSNKKFSMHAQFSFKNARFKSVAVCVCVRFPNNNNNKRR